MSDTPGSSGSGRVGVKTLKGEEVGKEGVFVLCTSSCIWAEPPL